MPGKAAVVRRTLSAGAATTGAGPADFENRGGSFEIVDDGCVSSAFGGGDSMRRPRRTDVCKRKIALREHTRRAIWDAECAEETAFSVSRKREETETGCAGQPLVHEKTGDQPQNERDG
jgi:hypothetical protein